MKKAILAASLTAAFLAQAPAASALTIGYATHHFDDKFSTILRNGSQAYAESLGHEMIQVDAQLDVGRQLDQVRNFIANGVDAIIIQAVDSTAAGPMSKLTAEAGVPTVFVNRKPTPLESMAQGQAYVASNEVESGTYQTYEMCKQLRAEGKSGGARGYLLVGDLASEAAVQRTIDAEQVVQLDMCNFMEIIGKETAMWQRNEAQDLMTNWLSTGEEFDFVIANNDEMALGAIQAMKSAGIDMKDVVVGGVDATDDALAAMRGGDLDVTVFQNAKAQGEGAVDAVLKLVNGEDVPREYYVPFELITPEILKTHPVLSK
ncbi:MULTISPECIES: substrate-binding domain-containing protein [unclassified Marinobacterium]|uniref:substrate-binding domain-containing protein n=1 Tax=unclassified Marinobacterium TaxID=2644139 RepID=UPI0015684671|nr:MULTISPECIES: substrate-binding domain-containing protein [unclassified Marinobacterium]NRP53297.1 D-galactose-binding periplasmic protein precursor [Marinobacterium sp. xm-v-242]NRP78082.1 D-galactose-binding periplasmic protein precursor [Marinobacterium sp. xm-m-383]